MLVVSLECLTFTFEGAQRKEFQTTGISKSALATAFAPVASLAHRDRGFSRHVKRASYRMIKLAKETEITV